MRLVSPLETKEKSNLPDILPSFSMIKRKCFSLASGEVRSIYTDTPVNGKKYLAYMPQLLG